MARLKDKSEQTDIVDVIENQTDENSETKNIELQKEDKKETLVGAKQKDELPKHILKIMETFYYLDELYISKHGGVFPSNASENAVKGSTLYKNPYFKK